MYGGVTMHFLVRHLVTFQATVRCSAVNIHPVSHRGSLYFLPSHPQIESDLHKRHVINAWETQKEEKKQVWYVLGDSLQVFEFVSCFPSQ